MTNSAYASIDFRELLKRRMEERGWSQSSLSHISGVSQPQISRMLSGKTKRLSRAVKEVCRYADLSVPQTVIDRNQERIIQQEIQKLLTAAPKKIEAILSLLKAASVLAAKSKRRPPSSQTNIPRNAQLTASKQ